jgi:hypothetical protein
MLDYILLHYLINPQKTLAQDLLKKEDQLHTIQKDFIPQIYFISLRNKLLP